MKTKKIYPLKDQAQLSALLKGRRNARISTRDLASSLDLDPAQVSRIENGITWPKFDQLRRFAGAMGFEICFRDK